MSDLAREIAQTVVRIKSEMRKARFASRSEAGRYAANQRWKNQSKKGKTPVDDLSIRGMTQTKWNADELRAHIDEQEGLLEAMRDIGASKAELKQQKGLITLARRDLRRMEESETKVEPKTPKSNKNISRQEADAIQRVDLFMRSTENLDQSVLDRMADKYKTGAVSDADRKLLDETKKEMLAAGEAAKTAIQDAFASGGRDATDKLGKTFTSSSRKTAKQMVAEGLERKSPTDPAPETTIRGTILQTKIMVFDRLALQLKDIPKALTDSYAAKRAEERMSKGKSFASRSEAGRYAANQRWKNNAKNSFEPNKEKYVAAAGGASPPDDPNKGRIAAEARWGAKGKGIKVDFKPEPPEPTRNDVGDLSAAKKIVRMLENDLNSLKETTGIKGKRMKERKAVCTLDGAKKAAKAPTKQECAKVVRDYEEKGMKTYRDNNQAYSRDAFDRAAGATEVFEARFGESISSYPESN